MGSLPPKSYHRERAARGERHSSAAIGVTQAYTPRGDGFGSADD